MRGTAMPAAVITSQSSSTEARPSDVSSRCTTGTMNLSFHFRTNRRARTVEYASVDRLIGFISNPSRSYHRRRSDSQGEKQDVIFSIHIQGERHRPNYAEKTDRLIDRMVR